GELVLGALDLDGGDGGALDAGEQDAAEGVADGGAEAALERLDDKAPEVRVIHLRVADDAGGKFKATPADTHACNSVGVGGGSRDEPARTNRALAGSPTGRRAPSLSRGGRGLERTPRRRSRAGAGDGSIGSDAAHLARAAAVVGDRGVVLHRGDAEARAGQPVDGGLAAGAGALDAHLELLHA